VKAAAMPVSGKKKEGGKRGNRAHTAGEKKEGKEKRGNPVLCVKGIARR